MAGDRTDRVRASEYRVATSFVATVRGKIAGDSRSSRALCFSFQLGTRWKISLESKFANDVARAPCVSMWFFSHDAKCHGICNAWCHDGKSKRRHARTFDNYFYLPDL